MQKKSFTARAAAPKAALRAAPGKPRTDFGRNLLSRPGRELLTDLEKALAATARAFPIPASHRKDLPDAVRDLSRMLTAERGEISRSYWSAPRFVSAYLRYFLPWNLFRLAWLLPGLDLGLKAGGRILDLGSGPLTLPLALWCARPDLRGLPLHFVCSDVAVKPMELGRDILNELSGGGSPWRISLLRAPVDKALRPFQGERHDCIMAANVLNELRPRNDAGESHLAGRLEELMAAAASALAPGGRVLLLEPGTRLGGKLIALSRQGALRHGFAPLAPCTHSGPCPALPSHDNHEQGRGPARGGRHGTGPEYSGWCHFIHPADGAPQALEELGRLTGLEKDSLALSCLLLEQPGAATGAARDGVRGERASEISGLDDLDDLEALYNEIMDEDSNAGNGPASANAARGNENPAPDPGLSREDGGTRRPVLARVLSAPIRLPDRETPGRYACCEKGLALLLDALRMPSGAAVPVSLSGPEERDPKSGALVLKADTGRKPNAAPGSRRGGKAREERMPPAARGGAAPSGLPRRGK